MSAPRLHIPDEPVVHLARWRRQLADGSPIDEVLDGPAGVLEWYWSRWGALERFGVDRATLTSIAHGYRREFGLWLRGERSHRSVASGFLGRVARRLPDDGDAPSRRVSHATTSVEADGRAAPEPARLEPCGAAAPH
jgi:hypothetical protein